MKWLFLKLWQSVSRGGTRDKPKNVCVGGYLTAGSGLSRLSEAALADWEGYKFIKTNLYCVRHMEHL